MPLFHELTMTGIPPLVQADAQHNLGDKQFFFFLFYQIARSFCMENLPLHFISFPPPAFRIIRGQSFSYLCLRGHPVLEFLTSFPYLPGVVVLCFYRAKVALASQDSDVLVR